MRNVLILSRLTDKQNFTKNKFSNEIIYSQVRVPTYQ